MLHKDFLLAVFLFSTLIASHTEAYEVIADPAYISPDDSQQEIIEQFIRQGKNCYLHNDAPGAIGYFARALLLEPSNQTARDALALINAQASLPAAQRIQLFLVDDFLALNEKLQRKLNDHTARRDALLAKLHPPSYSQTSIDQEFQTIRDRFLLPTDEPRQDISSSDPLGTLNQSLMLTQKKLSHELRAIQEQLVWLKETAGQKTHALTSKKKEGLAEPWQEIAGVHKELDELRQQIETLREELKQKDGRITALTQQVIDFSLRLTEREMILSEKINALGSLHDAYAELQSRQELGQKILEEKNSQVQSLQEGLAALQADTALHTKEINSLIAAKDQALDQWEKILAIYQGKLKDATQIIEARDTDITALQEQLALVRTKLFEKETALEKTKEKLVGLEKQFQSMISDPK